MFRNQYDNDVTVWSPQGRIHQIEYAMEAVKQGSAAVGIKSKTHAILVALKRASSELSAHQKKILPIDEHIGISIAGLTSDARTLSKFMRNECMNSRYAYETALPVSRLVAMIGNKSQVPTQRYGRRPFGVGLLIAGYDVTLRPLIKHGLRALRDTLPTEVDLNTKNCSLGIVGKDQPFTIYDDDAVKDYLALIEGEDRGKGAAAPAAGVQAMDADEPPAAQDPQPAEPQVQDQPMDQ